MTPNLNTILPQNLALLIPHQPHRPPHKCRQQIRNIKRIDNRRERPRSRPTLILVRRRRESEDEEDSEDGHFAGEDQRCETGIDVVVGHVLGGFEHILACEDRDDELWGWIISDWFHGLCGVMANLQFGERSSQ